MADEIREILEKLVIPQLPFPLSVPKEFALKCAKRAKENVAQAEKELKEWLRGIVGEKKEHNDNVLGKCCGGCCSGECCFCRIGWNYCREAILKRIGEA